MERKCLKCNKTIRYDDFVCPHCGAIIGDPVSYAATNTDRRKNRKSVRRWLIFSAAVLIFSLLAAGIILFSRHMIIAPTAPTTVPSTTAVPTQPPSTAPLTVYTFSVHSKDWTDLSGAKAHVYLHDQLIYTGELNEKGEAIFILPQAEGYSIRLTDLPVQYQANYTDVDFPFSKGEQSLEAVLKDLPLTFTVRVVDSAGSPIRGAGIAFYSFEENAQQQVTDENGCCSFVADYCDGSNSAYIVFVPNGYVAAEPYITFGMNSLSAQAVVSTYEELGLDSEKIYTVRVVDEYGQPASYVSLFINGDDVTSDAPGGVYFSGLTNTEGCFSFIGAAKYHWDVKINQNADYSGTIFSFEPGTRQMDIQLDLHKEPDEKYTYKVTFMDYSDVPIEGVVIAYISPETGETELYTSDENGIVTFQTTQADPSDVKYRIISAPDGYFTNRPEDTLYGFLPYERSTFVPLYYDGNVDYTVIVTTSTGSSVSGARVLLWEDGECVGKVFTDEFGYATIRTEPGRDFDYTFDYLPSPYRDYVIDRIERYGERIAYIVIAPPS